MTALKIYVLLLPLIGVGVAVAAYYLTKHSDALFARLDRLSGRRPRVHPGE